MSRIVVFKISFLQKILSRIPSFSNSLDSDQAQHFVEPAQNPNCLHIIGNELNLPCNRKSMLILVSLHFSKLMHFLYVSFSLSHHLWSNISVVTREMPQIVWRI